jgi:predicted transcriptional regulator|tara:strand:- start:68 stop:892 length:825 start_codon:yes stop_codon:yes gene_type:complete
MEGVRAVRILSVLAVASILAGTWMISSDSDESISANEEGEPFFAEESDSTEDGQLEQSRDEDNDGGEGSELPSRLIIGGAGALGSLLIGSLMLEFVKVTVLIALVSPMLAGMKRNREDMLTRGRILGYVEANAGIHFSALRDGLGLANGVTSYHLHTLESTGQVISWRDGKLRRYAVSTLSMEEVSRIKNPIVGTRLAILEVLADSGSVGVPGPEIRERLKISRQLLSHHLSELRNVDVVEAASNNRRPNWRISDKGMDILAASREISTKEAVR